MILRIASKCFLVAIVVFAASSLCFAQIDIQIRPRQMPGWDPRQREGHCELHVWVDNRADIQMRGDRIWVTTLQGAQAHDEGSACSQPLPYNYVGGFQIRQISGRNQVNIAQAPSRANNYTATIAIEDRQGGGASYAFDVSWRAEGNVATAPAPFFDDVRACQDFVLQRFLGRNVRGSYMDFDRFADRQSDNGNGRGRGRYQNQETIHGAGNARNQDQYSDFNYSCVIDIQTNQVRSADYQFTGNGSRSNGRNPLR